MDHLDIPAFGGVAGRILKEAFSFHTWLTGFFFGATIFVFGYMLGMMGIEDSAFFLAHLLVPVVVCRYALNGYHGEWRGSVFSTRGGGWLDVGLITFRYIALTAVWFIPLTLMGADPGSAMPSGVTILYMTAWVMSPPLLLVLSISAPNFASIFMPRTWADTFRGRWGDVLSLYVVYTGIVAVLTTLMFPVVFGLWSLHQNLGIAALVVGVPFTLGIMLSVMGRLAGFFPASSSQGPEAEPLPIGPEGPSVSGKPVLPNARKQVNALTAQYDEDPEYALLALEEMRVSHDPHPLVLHALAMVYHKEGRTEECLSVSEEALSLLLQNNTLKLAAELFLLPVNGGRKFDLSPEEFMKLGDYLQGEGHPAEAAAAYCAVVESRPLDAKAIKGVMKSAEEEALRGRREEAAQLYRFLLDRCSASPLAEYVEQGLEQVERRSA